MSHGLSQLAGVHTETWMKSNMKYKLATPNFDCPSSSNDLPVYCNRFVKNIHQSTKILKLIFFALFAHPNVPHKLCLIKLMYIFCDHFTDLMLSDCKERFSLSASILSSNMIVYLLYYHQIVLWQPALPVCTQFVLDQRPSRDTTHTCKKGVSFPLGPRFA